MPGLVILGLGMARTLDLSTERSGRPVPPTCVAELEAAVAARFHRSLEPVPAAAPDLNSFSSRVFPPARPSTFASLLIDAGVNPKAIQEFMGHATIEETFSRYGQLMPGTRNQARELVDAYLAAA